MLQSLAGWHDSTAMLEFQKPAANTERQKKFHTGYPNSMYHFRHIFIGSVCTNYCKELRLFERKRTF